MTNKGCKNNGEKCPNCSRIHRDMTGNNNPGSIFWKGRYLTKEHKDKVSRGLKGKPHSEEHKYNISKTLKGRCPENINMLIRKGETYKGKYGVEKAKKIIEKFSGKNSGAWKGGISFEPYGLDFTKKFKEAIRERDSYACLLCNMFDDDAKILYKKGLAVHHIDYDKKNTFPQNCISLCIKCHALTSNNDREIWTKHFQELLKKLYGYEYTIDQKIILNFIGNIG